jgi:hypothetical protein
MVADIFETVTVGPATQACAWVPVNELEDAVRMVIGIERENKTYPSKSREACLTTVLIIGEYEGIIENRVCHFFTSTAVEWAFVEQELISGDTQAPPINGPVISLPANNFRCYVSQATGDTSVQPCLRTMNSNIEVGYVRMALLIKEDIVRF